MTAVAPQGVLRSGGEIAAWNLAARVTGFLRVLAVGGAVGATYLGNTYQSANLVSNVVFELVAGGLLVLPLVPSFVALLDEGRDDEADRMARSLLGLSLVVLGGLAFAGALAGPWIMRALTVGLRNRPATRAAEIELGAFLLRFFLPQLVFYGVGAVASAALNARHRFRAAAAAPVANNVVVIATMIVFVRMAHGRTGLDIASGPRNVLALGTTAGVVAMSLVPLAALGRAAGWRTTAPAWEPRHGGVAAVARQGLWGGLFLAANQVLVAVTLVLANRVAGGVVAYQIAFTFFLLPVALVAHPLYTALYPRLSADAAAGRTADFVSRTGAGLRAIALTVVPAGALTAAVAAPALRLIRFGQLGAGGARLAAHTLAAYAVGVGGYAALLLLARAATAVGDARGAAIVGAAVASGGSLLLITLSAVAHGEGRVVVLGVGHSLAMTVGAAALARRVAARTGAASLRSGSAVARALAIGLAGGAAASVAVAGVPGAGRVAAAAQLAAGVGSGLAAVGAVGWLVARDDLRSLPGQLGGATA